MKYTLSIIILFLFFSPYSVTAQNGKVAIVTSDDLAFLVGNWSGSLTYLDYNSGQPYTMPAELVVVEGKTPRQLLLSYLYPDEPKANSKSKISISKDGATLNKKAVQSRKVLGNNGVEIIVEYRGKDGNEGKSASIRNIYLVRESRFSIRKEVKYEATDEWILRNEYSFQRD
jgi:hypothetical protein